MKMKNCFGCGYHKMEKDSKGIPYHYCNDRDCKVDPHDPICNYDN